MPLVESRGHTQVRKLETRFQIKQVDKRQEKLLNLPPGNLSASRPTAS